MQLHVDDVDAAYQRAGRLAVAIMPHEDAFWGDRFSMARDPSGHFWAIVTVKEELAPKEVW